MKQIPILYSTDMVQAQLDGRKTMTRRKIKNIEITETENGNFNVNSKKHSSWNVEKHELSQPFIGILDQCPYGKPGDIHWVREAIQLVAWDYEQSIAVIKYATGEEITFDLDTDEQIDWVVRQMEKMQAKGNIKPKESDNDEDDYFEFTDKPVPFIPSIHMPKWCARIYNRVDSIKVEQLQGINREDALKEGIEIKVTGEHTFYKDYLWKGANWRLNSIDSFESLWKSINGKESWKENPFVWVVGFTTLSTTGKPEGI